MCDLPFYLLESEQERSVKASHCSFSLKKVRFSPPPIPKKVAVRTEKQLHPN